MTRLIDADELRAKYQAILDRGDMFCEYDIIGMVDNAPTVEVPENAVNCVLTMFGKCSYNKTGCSDCKLKEKIRKALKNERPHGEWIYKEFDAESGISRSYWCSNCGEPRSQWCDDFCQRCGADMREVDNGD